LRAILSASPSVSSRSWTRGSFTTTYKFALLLALLDACQEAVGPDGSVPERIPTVTLAEHVVGLYWGQTGRYALPGSGEPIPIAQSHLGTGTKIQGLIQGLRAEEDLVTAWEARTRCPEKWARLVRSVVWELIVNPIPRLQRVAGGKEDRVLYGQDFEREDRDRPRHHPLTKQEFREHGMRAEIRLRPGVGEHLIRLGPLLRPVIQRHWVLVVQRMNTTLGESTLEDFLFGSQRAPTPALRQGLREVSRGLCFYCERGLRSDWEVDHFVPWVRHPDDGVHNLVVACRRCNSSKRALLAAGEHLERWVVRVEDGSLRGTLEKLAREEGWEADARRTVGVVRGQYLWLPASARLWRRAASASGRSELVPPPDRERILALLQFEHPAWVEDRPPRAAERPPKYGSGEEPSA
jgi:5-methylcytosine-specific restriction endonuclease McrA